MTVSTELVLHSYYPGAGQVPEAIPFQFLDAADLAVEWVTAAGVRSGLTRGQHYSVAGDGMALTGAITAIGAWDEDDLFEVVRRSSSLQKLSIPPHVPLPSRGAEQQFDRLTMRGQETDAAVADTRARALMVPIGESAGLIPSPAANTGRFLTSGAGGALAWSLGLGSDPGLREDLLRAEGMNFIAFSQPGANARIRSLLERARETVSLLDYRSVLDADDTAAIVRAGAQGRPVHMPAGKGLGPNGDYWVRCIASTQCFTHGTVFKGDGIGKTILRRRYLPGETTWNFRSYIFAGDTGSSDTADNICDAGLLDMSLVDDVVTYGFAEHHHLVHVNGFTRFTSLRVEYRGFRGDGLYIGAGNDGNAPFFDRHNVDIMVTRCRFDGLNNNNRNAISVIDGNGVLIEDNSFFRCSRNGAPGYSYPADMGTYPDYDVLNPDLGPGMPGAIDFEPDHFAWAVISGCQVIKNRFNQCGGNVATIGFYLPADIMTAPPNDFQVSDNSFLNYAGIGSEIYYNGRTILDASSLDNKITITGNKGYGGYQIYHVINAKGVYADGNSWENYRHGNTLGLGASRLWDCKLSDRFLRCANRAGGVGSRVLFSIFNVTGFSLSGSELIDCGDGVAGSYALNFNAGTSDFVALEGVKIRNRGGKTTSAVIKEASHNWSPANNLQYGNDWAGLPNGFAAIRSDVPQDFVPVLEGEAGTAGVGAYTEQSGQFTIIGGICEGHARVAGVAHSGVGASRVSLPVAGKYLAEETVSMPMTAIGAGMGIAAGDYPVAYYHSYAATALGPTVAMLYKHSGSARAAIGPPTGAFDIVVRFRYPVAN